MDLLHFLRKENAKPSGASTTQVQNYAEGEFDLVLGAYEARCLLAYVRLVGGDQCLLLPYAEETPQRTWCSQLDRLAVKELHRVQHIKKKAIKKRHIKEYRSHVRKQRVTATCNVRILNRKKPPALQQPDDPSSVDHVYEFSSSINNNSNNTNNKTSPDGEDNYDLMQKTQSVIDAIKRLNYLSDSATGSEFSMSNGSRQSSQSRFEYDDDDDGDESVCVSDGGGLFIDNSNSHANGGHGSSHVVHHFSHDDDVVEVDDNDEEFRRTGSIMASSSFASTAPCSSPLPL